MAYLYVKTPNGTQYSINLTTVNSGGGSAAANGYLYFNNGCILQWGNVTDSNEKSWPVNFSSAVYSMVSTFSDNSGSSSSNNAHPISTSKYSVYCRSSLAHLKHQMEPNIV